MSELVWTCRNGHFFVAELQDMQLVVRPAEMSRDYRFQLFGRAGSAADKVCVGSGQHAELREAMAIAERRAKLFFAQPGSAPTGRRHAAAP